jgi:hypothetical protein
MISKYFIISLPFVTHVINVSLSNVYIIYIITIADVQLGMNIKTEQTYYIDII